MGQVAVDALHGTLFKRAGEVFPAGIELLGQLYRGEGRVLIVSLQVGHGTLHQNVGAAGGRGLAAAGGQRDEQHHLRHLGFKNDVTHLGWQFLALGHPHKKALKIPLVADIRVQHGDAVHPGGVFQVCVAAAGLPEGVVDLDDQTVRVVVINIEDAGVVDLSREVDELADMHQINTAVDGVTHGAAADGQHQLMVGVGMDHGLVVFLVGIPCHQQFCVAQPHPCFRLCEEIIDILLASLGPAELLERLGRCPVDALKRHPLAILVLMRRMFTCQQIPKMMELKALLEAAVREHPELPAQERGNLLGECDLILSFLMYNDITRMSRLHRSASRQMTRPAVTLRNSGSWTFGSPSVLMMYYRAPGELGKELAEMYECMPHYYKITQGHGQGAELVMDAEAAFMQGHFERAVLLLERARVRAASCGQENMALCCDFLALRLSLCGQAGEPFDFEARRAALLQRHDAVLLHLLESIEAYYYALLGRTDAVPEVFREHRLASVSYFALCRPMMEMIELQVWLAQGQAVKVLARCEELLAACQRFHYGLVALHVRVQMAAAYGLYGQPAEARTALEQALAEAAPDGFWMPLAENYRYLAPLLAQGGWGSAQPLVERAIALGQRYEARRVQLNGSADRPAIAAALTEKELALARLVAQRRTNKEIAETLHLSEGTVKQYINQLYAKLDIGGAVRNKRAQLAALFGTKY